MIGVDENLRLFVRERLDLCALLAGLSAEEWQAATLDAGWTVEDLAAHIVVRERHLLANLRALLFRGRAGLGPEALLAREKARGHAALLSALRTMPPLFFRLPGPVARGNLAEAYIHHEDIRRGALRRPRQLPADLQQALWAALPLLGRRGLRQVPVAGRLTIEWPDRERRVVAVGRGRHQVGVSAMATLSGEPGELLLWLTGRKAAAQVELDGAVDLVAALRDAPMTL